MIRIHGGAGRESVMTNTRIAGGLAALGLMFVSTAASASITVDHTVANQLFGLDTGVMLEDFDAVDSPFTTFSGNLRGPLVSIYNVTDSAPPAYIGAGAILARGQGGNTYSADPTRYASVQRDTVSTLSVRDGAYLTDFSFYMGSPDAYNRVTFNYIGGSQVLDGANIWSGPAFGGDRAKGFRVYYDFGGAKVTSIVFSTGASNAFEFDGLAGTVAVPEPATWAMMIMGFGVAGAKLRRRRTAIA
jgi:hypothetical protein